MPGSAQRSGAPSPGSVQRSAAPSPDSGQRAPSGSAQRSAAPSPGSAQERILVLAPTGRDGQLTGKILREAGLYPELCPDPESLCRELGRGAGALVLAEEALGAAACQCLSVALDEQPAWSDIPLLICLRVGDITQARLQCLRMIEPLRNATYLERPIRIMTLISTLRAALAARRRQYQVRDYMIQGERAAAELRAAYERLQEADHRKDQFLALLGHELRNPLAAISTGVHLLGRSGSRSPEALSSTCALIARQSRHLARLVDDLLDVSRVTAGKIALKLQPLELNDLAARCLQAIPDGPDEAHGQGHELQLSPAPGPLWVDADPVRLEQVVVNLLTNAVKYTPPGGTIRLRLGSEGGSAVLRVCDNGLGIAPQMLPRVFELFSQAPQTLDRSQGGLGIGLMLVRSLVELHSGSVEAHSEGPGRGSEFTVRLPLRGPAAAGSGPDGAGGGPAPAGPASRRIVLVEDNADIRDSMQELLEDMGHQVAAAADGRAGVAAILAQRPEVALVDIGLPGMDGYEVARQVRAELRSGILLVAMTGYGQPEDHRRSLEAGFDAHLTKPAEIAAIETLLAR